MKNVKKLLALLLAMAMLFALCACGDSDSKKDDKDDDKKPAASQSANADPSTAPSNNSGTANKAPVGSWLLEEEDVIFTLNYDGTGVLDGEDINWELLSNNSLRLFGEDDDDAVILTFAYNGDSVSFTDPDGDVTVWVKYTGSTEEPDNDVDVDVDGEITYDDELIAVWYGEDGTTMDLAEGGNGTIYFGDSEEYELMWGVVEDVLCLSFNDSDMYFLYEIDANELQLTAEDGDTMTFVC